MNFKIFIILVIFAFVASAFAGEEGILRIELIYRSALLLVYA